MECVTIELSNDTLDELDIYAALHHAEDREEAVNQLLSDWLTKHE